GDGGVEFSEVNRLADDGRIAVVELLPQPGRDHNRRRWTGLRWRVGRRGRKDREVVVRETAGGHRQPEELEESFRDREELYVRRRSVRREQREVSRYV